ncbi:aldehyde dehydrogenase [Rhizobium sp. KAs_5_22]|uniref:aldehyde dehydrogenase n=1 Tax=Ciceribacter selenitireducens TaxID=448181 RepID=UPI0004B679F9|nr:aldehyde dehydrogenase [Ciceribacter selenitireducens]PPJ48969.1 aldehyde dehydrogenase [Rhizobium sp. KAs_5_22]
MKDWRIQLPPQIFEGFYIDGSWVRASSAAIKEVISPTTGRSEFSVPLAVAADVDCAIASAKKAFEQGPWPQLSPKQRGEMMHRLADRLTALLPVLVPLWTAQVGVPISLAQRLMPLAVARLRYFADLAASYEFDKDRETPRGLAKIVSEPVGVSALIIPWNAALPILMNKLGAALAAGCTCVIKPSPESPLDAMMVAYCAHEAGLPRGVINVVHGEAEASARLVASRDVAKVSFTGSVTTGRSIASVVAARMGRLTLELGGKSAVILLNEVELPKAMPTLEQFTMPFSGQFCFSQSRILVPREREDEIVEACAARIAAFKVGSPWDEKTQIGPVLNRRQFDRVMGYIEQGTQDGARVVTGGRSANVSNEGYYIEPTLFRDVHQGMAIARDEIFGPVVTVQAYDTVEEAIAIANDTDFGLSGSVFGEPKRAYDIARQLRTGQVGINGMEMAPAVPFGGYKMSGLGREGGPEGLRAFLETKAILLPS